MTAVNNPVFTLFSEKLASSLLIPEVVVHEWLGFIGCHPELRGLARIAENLIPILDLLKEIVKYDMELRPVTIVQWQSICRYIVAEAGKLSASFPEINIQTKVQKHPFPKMIEKYPLYIALWFQYPEQSLETTYRLLQAYLLLTQFHFRIFTESESKNYESTTTASTRLIRQFADSNLETWRPLLVAMPNEPQSMDDLLEDMRELQGNTEFSAEEFQKPIEILYRMLWYAEEHRGGFSRRNSRTWEAILKREAIRVLITESDPDVIALDFNIESIQMPSQTKADEGNSKRAGCAVGEVKAGVEHFIYFESNSDGTNQSQLSGRSPIAHIRRTRDKHHAVAMCNQLLPTQWGKLSLQELAIFHHNVSNLFREDHSGFRCTFSDNVSNRELAAVLTAMYWTSNDLATVIEYRFCKTRNDLPKSLDKAMPNDFRFVFDSEEWIHAPVRPSYKTPLKQQTKSFLNNTSNYIVLPIQNGIGSILRQHSKGALDQTKRIWRSKELFKGELSDYQKAVTAFLKSLNKTYKTRLTQKRIADDLFQRLYQYSGDLVEAMQITGRMHYLGTVPLHYSSPSLFRLQTVYTETCQLISNSIHQALEKPAKPAKINEKQLPTEAATQQYAGGRHYLRKGMVTKLLNGDNGLIHRFNESLKFVGFNDYWVNLHNDYTLYVAEMLGFATGYRAVRDPLDSLTQIDWVTGFACISDKDDLDYYNARLVWIPHLVLDQLCYYQQHCRLLGERLMLINPQLARKLLSHGEGSGETVPFLFLLRPNGKVLHLRPSEIHHRLQDIFPVPVNVNRSYLRTRLRELNCPGEMVNYFLGHWENGEEPFGPYSTLSPLAYKQTFAALLEQILLGDGWRAIAGFGRT